jgi:hypothetical protein
MASTVRAGKEHTSAHPVNFQTLNSSTSAWLVAEM